MSGVASGPFSDRLTTPTGLGTVGPRLFDPGGEIELHPRTLIRRFVVARLQEDAAEAAGRVYSSRSIPFQTAKLPAIAVYTKSERVASIISEAPRIARRVLQLVIEIYAGVEDGTDELLDTISKRCEVIVQRDETQGGLCDRTVLAQTESEVGSEGQVELGRLTLTFECTYNLQTDEDVQPAFSTADTQWQTKDAPPLTLIEGTVTFQEP